MDTETIMHNLYIVSMVKDQDKLVTGPRYGLRSPALTRAATRWWYGEGRQKDLDNLKALLSASINMLIICKSSDSTTPNTSTVNHERLLNQIKRAIEGVKILVRTYHDDHETSATLNLLMQDAKDRVNTVIPGSFTSDEDDQRDL